MNYHHPDEDFYRKVLKSAPPSVSEHGTEDNIKEKLQPMLPNRWRQEGNLLIAETENGVHGQTVPTNMLLIGTDENHMPIFRKISL
jgi:hypothetical protein